MLPILLFMFLDKASEQNKKNKKNNTACNCKWASAPQADSAPANRWTQGSSDAAMPQNRQLPKADDHAKTLRRPCADNAERQMLWQCWIDTHWCDWQCLVWCDVSSDALNGPWIIQSHNVTWTEQTFCRFLHINCLHTWGHNAPTTHVQSVNLIILHRV